MKSEKSCGRKRPEKDLLRFMEALTKRYPKGRVYVVWDNLNERTETAGVMMPSPKSSAEPTMTSKATKPTRPGLGLL